MSTAQRRTYRFYRYAGELVVVTVEAWSEPEARRAIRDRLRFDPDAFTLWQPPHVDQAAQRP